MSRSLPKRLWYDALRFWCRIVAVGVFRMRCYGREHVPATGSVIVLSNHQSHLDPLLVGAVLDRRVSALARQSLFKFAPVRWLIVALDTIPIDRDGTGLGGLKETLRRLKRGEMVLIFPEGTRSADGVVARLKPGFLALARRSGASLLPVGIDGAYEAWPRRHKLPRPASIGLAICPPISPEQVASLDDEQLLQLVHERICQCQHLARRRGGAEP